MWESVGILSEFIVKFYLSNIHCTHNPVVYYFIPLFVYFPLPWFIWVYVGLCGNGMGMVIEIPFPRQPW